MRPQQLALPSRQIFLHHSCRRITPQSRFRVAHLSATVVLGHLSLRRWGLGAQASSLEHWSRLQLANLPSQGLAPYWLGRWHFVLHASCLLYFHFSFPLPGFP